MSNQSRLARLMPRRRRRFGVSSGRLAGTIAAAAAAVLAAVVTVSWRRSRGLAEARIR
jgi:hypothetical protein